MPKPTQLIGPAVPILAAQPQFLRSIGDAERIVLAYGNGGSVIMSVLQRTIRMFVMAAMAVAGPLAFSQNGYHPSAEPINFDPDWQFFAPVQLQDMEDLSARQRANKGFYATYDRMNIAFSRSDTEPGANKMDFTWGNRFDFGWMKENDRGWNFSVINITGPNEYNIYEQVRIHQYLYEDEVPDDRTWSERIYEIADSVNVANFSSFEANKTWRMEPYRYGGILEPMIGIRYAQFRDFARNDTYTHFEYNQGTFDDPDMVVYENLLRDYTTTDNHMLLGQFGFRYTKQVRRWTFSNDAKVFAGHVFQSQNITRESITAYIDSPVAAGDDPLQHNDRQGTNYAGRDNDESTVGFDIRVEGAYKATKYLDLRAGFQMLYFGRGIWRGSTLTEQGNQFSNDQHLIMPGFTFGVALNR